MIAAALSVTAAAQPAPEKRVALVIGIEDYASARRLANPVRGKDEQPFRP